MWIFEKLLMKTSYRKSPKRKSPNSQEVSELTGSLQTYWKSETLQEVTKLAGSLQPYRKSPTLQEVIKLAGSLQP